MKILKYGKVIISENDIIIQDFEIDVEEGYKHEFYRLVKDWTIKRINQEFNKQFEVSK